MLISVVVIELQNKILWFTYVELYSAKLLVYPFSAGFHDFSACLLNVPKVVTDQWLIELY